MSGMEKEAERRWVKKSGNGEGIWKKMKWRRMEWRRNGVPETSGLHYHQREDERNIRADVYLSHFQYLQQCRHRSRRCWEQDNGFSHSSYHRQFPLLLLLYLLLESLHPAIDPGTRHYWKTLSLTTAIACSERKHPFALLWSPPSKLLKEIQEKKNPI